MTRTKGVITWGIRVPDGQGSRALDTPPMTRAEALNGADKIAGAIAVPYRLIRPKGK